MKQHASGVSVLRKEVSISTTQFHPCGIFHLNSRGREGVREVIDVMHCYAVGAYYLQPAPNCLPRQVADRSGAGDADAGLSVNVSTKFFNDSL